MRLPYLSFPAFIKVWKRLGLYSLLRKGTDKYVARRISLRTGASGFVKSSQEASNEKNIDDSDNSYLEYAVEPNILETPSLDFSYYADVVGEVPPHQDWIRPPTGFEPFDIGNGDIAPEWGVDIVVRGGFFHYGPWADRQR